MYDYMDFHYVIHKAGDDHNQHESISDDCLVKLAVSENPTYLLRDCYS